VDDRPSGPVPEESDVPTGQPPAAVGGVDPDPAGRSAFHDTRPTSGDESTPGLAGLSEAVGLPTAVDLPDPLPGMVIGNVRVLRLIAEGGMGRVYEGLQERPARPVALKVMRPGVISRQSQLRFLREAEILGRLDHPGIARILTAGTHPLGGASVPYFVMELVPEATTITAHADARGLSLDERIDLFRAVCEAVAFGHRAGVVHRDLKPANVLVDASGRPKVIDFGVARGLMADQVAAASLTATGQFVGTWQYMSPEQFRLDEAAADPRSDVYALGLILYELLVGRPPYTLTGRDLLEAADIVCKRAPTRPRQANRQIPAAVERVIERCLRKRPEDRFADAAALAAALESCRAPAAAATPTRRLAVAGGLAGLLAAAATLWTRMRPADRGGPDATPLPPPFTFVFDLRSPPGPELVKQQQAQIHREGFGEHVYWAPEQVESWAEIIYRFEAPFPIGGVALDRVFVQAWNAHEDVTFDPRAAALLDISPDGVTWTPVSSTTPALGKVTNADFAEAVSGARQVFLRARLYESRWYEKNRVHYAQFLRGEPDRGVMPSITLRPMAAPQPAPGGLAGG
jgi:hypothetical protein